MIRSELAGVSAADYVHINSLQNDLNKILREEEIKWYQRSKERDIKEGDSNTKYFMIKASGRKRKSKIFRLIQDEGIIQGDDNLLKYATNFYKDLFGHVDLPPISLCIPLDDVLSEEDKVELSCKFTMDEVKNALFSMKRNSAAGPDGFPAEFFQFFWNLICNDLLRLFHDFYEGKINISRLNYGVVTLLAKGQGADRIQMYRPICMLNVPFKNFTKVLNNRAMKIADKTISKAQSAFIKGRYILDNVLMLHEAIHSLHRKKCSAVLFKVDFEKAYDKINWSFMLDVLKMKGFPERFVQWTKDVVSNGKVAITINDVIGPYFVTRKGLRQGDPFSPLLFNLAADVLATLVQRAQEQGFIKGVLPRVYAGGLNILQYADDTIFCFEDDLEGARNLKIILCVFEHLTGLKINFLKSEIFCFGKALEKQADYAGIFTCAIGGFPFRYLGLPLHYKKLCNADWKSAEEKVEKGAAAWQGGLLSMGGRLIRTETCLSNIISHLLNFFRLPKGVGKRINFFRARVLWQEREGVRKYHLVNWLDVCQPRDQGGLGVTNLDIKNISLLCKWLWRLENEDGDWQEMIRAKYLKRKTLSQCESSPANSHFWNGIMSVKDIFYNCCQRIVGDGHKTRFWEDAWIHNKPLCQLFPRLYKLTFHQNITVAKAFEHDFNCIRFRRCLYGETLDMWNKLLDMCSQVVLSEEPDKVNWLLTSSGQFSVKSLYQYIIAKRVVFPFKFLWKLKVPLKIKAFIWLVIKGRILTKDNLCKKGWKGTNKCEFCDANEYIDHLFFTCSLARFLWNVVGSALGNPQTPLSFFDLCQNWLPKYTGKDRMVIAIGTTALLWSIWKARNKSCFQSSLPRDPTDIIVSLCYMLDSWGVLQKRGVEKTLKEVTKRLAQIARDVFKRAYGWGPAVRRLC